MQEKDIVRKSEASRLTSPLESAGSFERSGPSKDMQGQWGFVGKWGIVFLAAWVMFGGLSVLWLGLERLRFADRVEPLTFSPRKQNKEHPKDSKMRVLWARKSLSTVKPFQRKSLVLPRLEIPAFRSSYIQKELDALRDAFDEAKEHQERAILAGLHWMARYVEVEKRFRSVFSDYVLALHELTLFEKRRPWVKVVRSMIRRSFERAWGGRKEIFARSVAGKWDFISLIYLLYQHDIPRESYVKFYHQFFPKGEETTGKSFSQALRERDYDRLGDFIIDTSFLDLFLRKYPHSPFRLPKNRIERYIRGLESLPLIHSYASNKDGYHDQNYFVTHVILSLNHYSESPLPDTPLLRSMLRYLKRELWNVRHKVDDIDLLAEFVYSFKCYGAEDLPSVREAHHYLLTQQRSWGAWGKEADWKGDAYDAIHPTLAAITALNYRRWKGSKRYAKKGQ